jgi:benzoylformate decarboxylase
MDHYMPVAEDGPAETVRDATFSVLRRHRIELLFGNPGSTEVPFLLGFPADFRYVLGLHESAVVGMATGYAHRTGSAAVVNLHTAAGLGNAVAAITTARLNHTPLVLIAGQQARSHLALRPFLAGDLEGLAGAYLKSAVTPVRAADVPGAVERAIAVATCEPAGPVLVIVPMDDWDAPAEPLPDRWPVLGCAEAPDAVVTALAAEIDAATAPVLVAGAGVDRGGAWSGAIALAERLGAPVWQEPMSARAGFPQDHPLWTGVLPPSRAAICDRLAGHDLAIVLGAPVFRYYLPEAGPMLPPGCRVLHLTADPDEAADAPVGRSVVAALAGTLPRLAAAVAARMGSDMDGTSRPAGTGRSDVDSVAEPSGPLTAATLVAVLAAVTPAHATVVEECPSVRPLLDAGLPARRPGGWVSAAGGGLGFGLPGAVGLALADPARPVLCVVGDGSAAFGLQALWSAARYRAPAVFCVLVNNTYGVLVGQTRGRPGGDAMPGLDIAGLDFAALAAGFGVRHARADDAADLIAILRAALPATDEPSPLDGPLLVECRLAPQLT